MNKTFMTTCMLKKLASHQATAQFQVATKTTIKIYLKILFSDQTQHPTYPKTMQQEPKTVKNQINFKKINL